VLVGIGAALSAEFCTFELGCDDGSSGNGVGVVVAALGVIAFAAAPFVAARRAGRGLAALGALVATLVVGAVVFTVAFDDVAPAVVAALAAVGIVAVPAPTRRAGALRLGVTAALLVVAAALAAAHNDGPIFVLALLTFPALAAADAVAR
jgi:hypothetical protein